MTSIRAAERLADAVLAQEPVGIVGDYDVDGATCDRPADTLSALVGRDGRGLRRFPDRIRDGSAQRPHAWRSSGRSRLSSDLVTLDTGTTAFEPLRHGCGARARGRGHRPSRRRGDSTRGGGGRKPEPHRPGEPAQAPGSRRRDVRRPGGRDPRPARARRFRGPEAGATTVCNGSTSSPSGTVCDVVPLTGLNRALCPPGVENCAGQREHGRPGGAGRGGLAHRHRRRPAARDSCSARGSTPAAGSADPISARACSPPTMPAKLRHSPASSTR